MKPNMSHTEYQKALKSKTNEALAFTIKDAKETIRIYPESENINYYTDEILYATMELSRRV